MIEHIHLDAPRTWIYLRDLMVELVSREIKLRYRRSLLGYAWSMLNPLLQLVVLSLVFQFLLRLNVPNYLPFLFTGLLAWNWFQASLLTACGSIVDNRELVRRPGFPVEVLPLVSTITNFIHFLLALPVLLLVMGVFRNVVHPTVLFLPILFVLQFLVTVSVSFFLATFYVTFRDTQYLLGIGLMLGFYLTPVFYPSSVVTARYQLLYRLNPITVLIDSYRQVLLEGRPPDLVALSILGIVFSLILWIGYGVFKRASYRFTEEL